MNLHYEGAESVDGTPEQVFAFLSDPNRVGPCLPDVQSIEVKDATHFDAVVKVAVGLVRGKFKYKVELQPDQAANAVVVKASGGGLGSAVDMAARADLAAAGAGTELRWTADGTARGPVATVGGRVLDAQAEKLISQLFKNIRTALDT